MDTDDYGWEETERGQVTTIPQNADTLVLELEIPQVPLGLNEIGAGRWNQIAEILVKGGYWSDNWYPSLEHLCRQYEFLDAIDQVIAAEEATGGFSLMVPTGRRSQMGIDEVKLNPLMEHRLEINKFIRMCMNDFGLTPRSNSRKIAVGVEVNLNQQQREPEVLTRPRLVG